MKKNMLVVVDMVNGFVNFGALADNKINKITPKIIKLIESAKKNGMDIVAFRDCHIENDEEFNTYPVHCLKGSEESQLIPELKLYEKDMILIDKNTTNGFNTTKFQKLLLENNYENVYVVGCCTDICVKDFVTSYMNYLKNINRFAVNFDNMNSYINTKIHVVSDACYTFDGLYHNAEQMHNSSIEYMKNIGANIVTIENTNTQENI